MVVQFIGGGKGGIIGGSMSASTVQYHVQWLWGGGKIGDSMSGNRVHYHMH